MSETLFRITTEDAEAVMGRKLLPGEASSIRKTLESALAEDAADALAWHASGADALTER